MKIRKLSIENFKGLTALEVPFNEDETLITGRNGAGKTTISDAFFWLLFGTDSQNRSKFQYKPLDQDNNEINHLRISVKGTFVIDNVDIDIEKIEEEKWITPNGEIDARYSGNKTEYYIDDVPQKKNEFDSKIKEIAGDIEIFKVLSNVNYFNESLSWKARRVILSNLIKDVNIKELAQKREFKPILTLIEKYPINDIYKTLKHQKEILIRNKEEIPVRINEIQKTIGNIEDISQQKEGRKVLQDDINTLMQPKQDLEAERKIKVVTNKIFIKMEALETLQENLNSCKNDSNTNLLKVKRDSLTSKININQLEIQSLRRLIDNDTITLKNNNSEVVAMREEYKEENKKVFETKNQICSCCGQKLPTGKIKELEDKFLAAKIDKTKSIIEKAKNKQNYLKVIAEQITQNEAKSEKIIQETKNLHNELEKITIPDNSKEIKTIEDKISSIKEEISLLKSHRSEIKPVVIDNSEEIKAIQNKIDLISSNIANIENSQKAIKRIETLNAEHKEAINKLNMVLEKSALMDKLNLLYIETIEKNVNGIFNNKLKVKLFEQQINGGYKETCQILTKSPDGNLIPYKYSNTGAKINAGLQVINALSEKYDKEFPVFVDNSESVGNIFDIRSQIIKLKMVDSHKRIQVK